VPGVARFRPLDTSGHLDTSTPRHLDTFSAPSYHSTPRVAPGHAQSGMVGSLVEFFVMAHKKGQGSTRNGRDSNPQFLGVKHYGGETVRAGGVIIRQRGTPHQPGFNVRRGKDDTLFSIAEGKIVFQGRKVHVDPTDPDAPRPFYLKKLVQAN